LECGLESIEGLVASQPPRSVVFNLVASQPVSLECSLKSIDVASQPPRPERGLKSIEGLVASQPYWSAVLNACIKGLVASQPLRLYMHEGLVGNLRECRIERLSLCNRVWFLIDIIM
jgi:hypothetical protein